MDDLGPVVKSAAEGRPAAAGAIRSSGRAQAVLEVAVCSGFPTQLLLGAALATIGLRAMGDAGNLSFGYVVTLSLVDAVLVVGLIGFFLRARGESLRELVLGGRSPRAEARLGLLLVPALVAGVIAGTTLLGWVAPGLRNVPENPFESLLDTPGRVALFAIVAIVAGGIREELQRAFILRRFEQHLGGGWLGLVIFSTAFGLGHQIQGWDAAILTGLLGAGWGAMYLIRRSAVAPMVSHAGFNVAEILLALAAAGSG
ncbi:MAG: type II CAAX endopeptidase family protein [Acidobacteria bacterium]|nr:type II CAAX endopeptidase family protein [Acidobacteriota bacterium]